MGLVDLLVAVPLILVLAAAKSSAETEGSIAALAAKRATKDELDSLEMRFKSIQTLKSQSPPNIETFINEEIGLHQQLAESCGNAVYQNIAKTILTVVLYPKFQEDVIDNAYIREAVRDWRNLLDALRIRDSVRAKKIMVKHIRHFDQMAATAKTMAKSP